MSKLLTELGLAVLKLAFSVLSPVIKKALSEALQGVYVKACNTSNPFDDFFVEVIADLAGVKLEKPALLEDAAVTMPEEGKVAVLGYDPLTANRAIEPATDFA